MPILANLRTVRERRLLSQAELSKATGVAQRTLSELERGIRTAQGRTTRKLAKALKVDPAELMGDNE
ncbi:MAG TPA: helix-turn-helix transcriptional regulator [Chloroflexota bacterium]